MSHRLAWKSLSSPHWPWVCNDLRSGTILLCVFLVVYSFLGKAQGLLSKDTVALSHCILYSPGDIERAPHSSSSVFLCVEQ